MAFEDTRPTRYDPDNRVTSFSLYEPDLAKLRAVLAGADGATFDVDSNGFVQVHVAGKDTLEL